MGTRDTAHGTPRRIDCAGCISAGLSTCGVPGMIVGKAVGGKTGAIITESPGGAPGAPEDTGDARVDIGGTGGERDAGGGVTGFPA